MGPPRRSANCVDLLVAGVRPKVAGVFDLRDPADHDGIIQIKDGESVFTLELVGRRLRDGFRRQPRRRPHARDHENGRGHMEANPPAHASLQVLIRSVLTEVGRSMVW